MDGILDQKNVGHRERLRQHFLNGEHNSHTDEVLLELLLTYSIPQKDVQPLAHKLLAELGSLSEVLAADIKSLTNIDGIKSYSAILLKLVDYIRNQKKEDKVSIATLEKIAKQASLFDVKATEPKQKTKVKSTAINLQKIPVRSSRVFSKAVLKEAIGLLPGLPNTKSLKEIREYLRQNLHFNAKETRRRYADHITQRMFPYGYADIALKTFASKYAEKQELRDVAYFRFCKSEPLMFDIATDLLIPSMGSGIVSRDNIRNYLTERFPISKSINDCVKAIVDVLEAGGIARADKKTIKFGYRNILLSSFAFVLHSEFPDPGIYEISKLENNLPAKALLWNQSQILPCLYELRNKGIISKVSEIDTIRQFSTILTLNQLIEHMDALQGARL